MPYLRVLSAFPWYCLFVHSNERLALILVLNYNTCTMQRQFYFVDGIQPNGASRRLMRRHVMQGKNAGKRVYRKSKLGLEQPRSQTDIPVASLIRTGPGSLLTFLLPIDMTRESVEIIDECKIVRNDPRLCKSSTDEVSSSLCFDGR